MDCRDEPMTRIVWSTDIHLNFVQPEILDQYVGHLVDAAPDYVVLSGDIAESRSVVQFLSVLNDRLDCQILFVLGNHDYYYGSIAQTRDNVRRLCAERDRLVYMTDAGCVKLAENVGLVGHDGWADGRIGDYERSMILMNDYRLIDELSGLGKKDRWQALKALGDEAAVAIHQSLPQALGKYEHVFLVTHVPPLRAACWYNGRLSDDEWAPHFTCKAVGDALLELAQQYPQSQLTVLCGHTHSPGECKPLANMQIFTGGAEYGFPAINKTFRL
jgi:predicted MPP superfamily phosphohydrolase